MLDVSMVQKMLEPLFPGLMGVRLTELGPDRVLAEREVRADLCTAGGILHGGATMAFADTPDAVRNGGQPRVKQIHVADDGLPTAACIRRTRRPPPWTTLRSSKRRASFERRVVE